MVKLQPTRVKGTRDFGPFTMLKRNYLLKVIREVFQKFGFMPLETPALENLSTLTGKYGEEGEQLIFKILDSGDFLKKAPPLPEIEGAAALTRYITQKGLRYDLTIPLARYIAQNRHTITTPFKRFQIQPVWRADRPQKGRYREFYQCDGDIVGAHSLFYETELVAIIQEVLSTFGLEDFILQLNHRSLFKAIALQLQIPEKEQLLCTVLDKIDKIGWEKVAQILEEKGLTPQQLDTLHKLLHPSIEGDLTTQLTALSTHLADGTHTQRVLHDLETFISYLKKANYSLDKIRLTPTLARGMNYYTGLIFEVIIPQSGMGSIAAGGRYDQLTTLFGMEPTPCVGFSFGLERIYEILISRSLLPENATHTTFLLIAPLNEESLSHALPLLKEVRQHNISTELFPPDKKLKKALSYANAKKIPFVLMIDSKQAASQPILKNMQNGVQESCDFRTLVAKLQKYHAEQNS